MIDLSVYLRKKFSEDQLYSPVEDVARFASGSLTAELQLNKKLKLFYIQ